MKELSRNQEKFLIALLDSGTVVEASKKAGITTPTAYKYLNDPIFKKKNRELRREKFEGAVAKIVDSVDDAIEVLKQVMNDEEEVGATRVQAARTVIANAFKSYELQEIEERLEQLEENQRAGNI